MKKGDLISFKPVEHDSYDDWSNPAIVLRQCFPTHPQMWVVWCEGDKCVIDEDDYDVVHLTTSSQESA